MIKVLITQIVDDWTNCMTAEEAEIYFGTSRFIQIMFGLDSRWVGEIDRENHLLGYVND